MLMTTTCDSAFLRLNTLVREQQLLHVAPDGADATREDDSTQVQMDRDDGAGVCEICVIEFYKVGVLSHLCCCSLFHPSRI